MDAVGAADLGRVLEFPRALLESMGQADDTGVDELGGLLDQQGLSGVDYVVRREAVVEPARLGADEFGDGGVEGDDVVVDFGLDFLDAFELEVGAITDGFSGLFGDPSGFGEGFGGGKFDLEPGAEAVFFAPDAADFGASVAVNQRGLLGFEGTEDSNWAGGASASWCGRGPLPDGRGRPSLRRGIAKCNGTFGAFFEARSVDCRVCRILFGTPNTPK